MAHNIPIKLSIEIIERCKIFAADCVKTNISHYKERNQDDIDIIQQQIFIGKLGEYAAYQYLKDKILNISEPDIKIYESKDKSFDVDLKSNDIKIHCKTQSIEQSHKFGMSWIFQHGKSPGHMDKEVFDPSINREKQFVIFVVVDLKKSIGYIMSFMKIYDLHNLKLFKLPSKKMLQTSKLAIYYKDIKDLSPEILWAPYN